MLSRAWLAAIALGLTLATSAVHGQQAQEQDGQGQAGAQESPAENAPWALPVEIIGDEAETEARQRSKERAEQRELNDLAAQQGMNEATQKMADYSLYQTILIAIGTAALIYTLYLTRQANRAAVRGAEAAESAVSVTRDSAEKELRAYVSVENIDVRRIIDRESNTVVAITVTIVWKNAGQTPARKVRNSINYGLFEGDIPSDFDFPDPDDTNENISVIGPGQIFRSNVNICSEELARVFQGERRLYYWGWIEYSSLVEGERHRTETCSRIEIFESPTSPDAHMDIALHRDFNGMDDDCRHQPKT